MKAKWWSGLSRNLWEIGKTKSGEYRNHWKVETKGVVGGGCGGGGGSAKRSHGFGDRSANCKEVGRKKQSGDESA